MVSIWKKILIITAIFLIGGLGGIAGERLIFPYLAGKPFFEKIKFIREAAHGTTIINKPADQVVIRENEFLEESIKRVNASVVGVRALDKRDRPVTEGTGFVITADGLIVTANKLVPAQRNYEVMLDGNNLEASLKIRDSASGLALLKVEKSNLPVISFGRPEEIRLGELAFLLAADFEENEAQGIELVKFVNVGIIRSIKAGELETNILETNQLANGSPLFNIEGKVVGLNLIDTRGNLSTVSVKKIRDLLNIALR